MAGRSCLCKPHTSNLDSFGSPLGQVGVRRSTRASWLARRTQPGLVMGTVGYMSPEQVRGQTADHRADIFAFGAILYEMLTGKRAFQKPTSPETMTAILNEDPPGISQTTPGLSPPLQRIVHRCLEKNPEQRFQSASDLAFALAALTDAPEIINRAPAKDDNARRRYIVFAACVALLIAAFAAYYLWPRSPLPLGPAKITQLSQWNKPIKYAKLSPDGHAVAFVSPVGGVAQVFLILTSGGEPLQLTKDEDDKFVDTFSADGKEIYFKKSLAPDEVWAIPTLGGSPRRVMRARQVLPSPDGAFIYYTKSDSAGIFRAEKSGLNEELVYNFEKTGLDFIPLLLFPDGNNLLCAASSNLWTELQFDLQGEKQFHFYRIRATSHEAVDLGEVTGNALDVVWGASGETVLFSRNVNGLINIWKYGLNDRRFTQITFGAGSEEAPMPDPGGNGTYFVNGKSSGFLTAYHVVRSNR